MMDLTEQQLERYSRHIILEDVGVEGQSSIMGGKVLIVGTGGLGSPAGLYLAAAGVGTIGLVDPDHVELSNLQRQVIHFSDDVDSLKVSSAAEKMRALNPGVTVNTYNERLVADNVRQIIQGYDFVIDGTDHWAAKYLINDACVMESIPFSHGGILRFSGQTMTIVPRESACIRCVLGPPPPRDAAPSCAEAGVLSAIPGILGTIQTTEAPKFLTGSGTLLANAMLFFDALTMEFKKQRLRKNRGCALCGEEPTISGLFDEEQPICEI